MATAPTPRGLKRYQSSVFFFCQRSRQTTAELCINSHHCKRFAAQFSLRIWRECNRWSRRWHTSFVFLHFVFVFFYILYLCILRQFWKCNGWWIRWQSNAMEVNSGLTSTSSNKFGARVTTPDLWLFYWDHMKLGSKKGQIIWNASFKSSKPA